MPDRYFRLNSYEMEHSGTHAQKSLSGNRYLYESATVMILCLQTQANRSLIVFVSSLGLGHPSFSFGSLSDCSSTLRVLQNG